MQDTITQDSCTIADNSEADKSKPWWMRRNEKLSGGIWWRKDHKMTACRLPLEIPDTTENLSGYIQQRLRLIKLYDFLDYGKLIELLEKARAGKDCSLETEAIKRSFPLQINDFDHTELVASALKDKSIPDQLRECMIPRNTNVKLFADQAGFLEHESKYVMEKVSELALPRIRAKLAYRECLFLVQPTWNSYCELVQLCPTYLNSRWATGKLHVYREKAAYGSTEESINAKASIKMLQNAMLGQTKRQARQYSYFQIHQEFKDMVAAFKAYAANKKNEKKSDISKKNLLLFAEVFEISKGAIARVISERSKPTHHALDILVEKKRIESHATYHNKVKPYLNELYKIYPDLKYDWSHVRRFMDLCIRYPNIFGPINIWTQLEDFKMPHPSEFKDSYPILANWV